MCGISGILDFKHGVEPALLKSMTDVIRYRGPDDAGYLLFGENTSQQCYGKDTIAQIRSLKGVQNIENLKKDHYFLGLAHRRLSILDLTAAGHQPMTRQGLTLTFNGEIYNYVELRQELEEKGYIFETESDTEVLLRSYQHWQEECVLHFNGMWAFAIWDSKKKRLFCSRDRFGVKPFHYYIGDGRFVFGSELKQIVKDKSIPKRMNEEVLAANLIYGITDFNDQTLIQSIEQLGAGVNLMVQMDGEDTFTVTKYRYWDLDMGANATVDEQETDRGYMNLLHDSVRLRLRSDVKVGALLSGGLDSSALVTIAGDYCKKMPTFTACYREDQEHDESGYAHTINLANHCEENFVYPEPVDVEKEFESIVWHMEGISSLNLIGFFSVLKTVQEKGIKVVLNGQGSDESILGYERYYAFYLMDILKKKKFGQFVREFRKIAQNSKLTRSMLMKYFLYFNFPRIRSLQKKKQAQRYVNNSLFSVLPLKELHRILYPENLKQMQYNELFYGQLPFILRMDDRGYMAHSLESRAPFLDYRYMEYCALLPAEYKIRDGYTKYILRFVMQDKMPQEVVWRKNKIGFSAPIEKWTGQFSESYMDELFCHARSARYFDIDKLKTLYKDNSSVVAVSNFVTIELFMRMFEVE
ncbi:asparagine synthase (glutamine-hydrolyzing) [Anaerovorax sp. IOR16]|uniref:asparagine synthase (glutamine-hydrolyzing) n=1 Tax=Anaerovorax sp. IOR16 TaxID=2773458 RepID=UPI0019D18697|nr:asparagine synthase (glutamine-hydrolyzing) [Anaerovorax sp. IOR16]